MLDDIDSIACLSGILFSKCLFTFSVYDRMKFVLMIAVKKPDMTISGIFG